MKDKPPMSSKMYRDPGPTIRSTWFLSVSLSLWSRVPQYNAAHSGSRAKIIFFIPACGHEYHFIIYIYTLVVYLLSMYNALIRNMTWVFGGFVYYCQLLYNTLSIYLVTYSCFILLLWKKLQKVLEMSLLDILYKILFSKEVQLWTY